jgi:hypothetical protein
MATIHYHRRRSAAERELDLAIAAAEHRTDLMQARVDVLEAHIVAARSIAAGAGVFDERIVQGRPQAPGRRRPRRLAARTALTRATLRSL